MTTTIACIQGAHAIAAHFGGPVWLVNDEDAKNYAVAINNVARHYDLAVAQKTIDICNLVGMIAFVEGTRFLAMRQQQRQPARGHNGGPPLYPMGAQVFAFSPPATTPSGTPAGPGASQPAPVDPMPPPGEGALH